MLRRFAGEDGRRLRVEALLTQKLVGGNHALAEALADEVTLLEVNPGDVLITQGASE